MKEPKVQRSWVEPEQLLSLLEGAPAHIRPVLATLAGAGLRVGEACALNWKDVNLATGTLTVRRSKTAAGEGREVDLPGGLLEELKELKVRSQATRPGDPVFIGHLKPQRRTEAGVSRCLNTALRRANRRLDKLGVDQISMRVTPHSLRRTYASIRGALRDDPIRVAEQGGWTDPTFVFRTYQKAAKRREKLAGAYLAEFDRALDWARIGSPERAPLGTTAQPEGSTVEEAIRTGGEETAC